MKILVTGGCGYKGTVLVSKLLDVGHEVYVIDTMWFGNMLPNRENLHVEKGDVRQPKDEWFAGTSAIIHLASVANDPCADLDAKLSWETSPLGTMLLIEKAIEHNVKSFIYASSGSVYGVSEADKVDERTPLNPISDYNKAKMVTERILMSYADKISVQIIRPATVCGYSPRMRLDVAVNMLTMQALHRKEMTVFGGNQTRPNIHIDDITDLYIFLLSQDVSGVYNAGFENLSILDIANQIAKLVPAKITVTESNDPRSYRLNSDKLLSIGFKPKKTVQNAIEELIVKYQGGELIDADKYYNIKTMKALAL